jgi:hypothetical protein
MLTNASSPSIVATLQATYGYGFSELTQGQRIDLLRLVAHWLMNYGDFDNQPSVDLPGDLWTLTLQMSPIELAQTAKAVARSIRPDTFIRSLPQAA